MIELIQNIITGIIFSYIDIKLYNIVVLLEDLEHSGKAKWMVILTFWLFVYNFPTEQICFQQE